MRRPRACLGPTALRGRTLGGRLELSLGLVAPLIGSRRLGLRSVAIAGRLAQRVVDRGIAAAGRWRRGERIAAHAVPQREVRRAGHMLRANLLGAIERGERERRLGAGEIAAHAVEIQPHAGGRDAFEHRLREAHTRQALARRSEAARKRGVGLLPAGREAGRVGIEGHAPADDLGAHLRIARPGHLHPKPEAIQQLRTQLALLRVHRADEQEPRGLHDRDAVALHTHPARRGRIEERIDEVVAEQVHLVDVEHAAVGLREQPR